MAIALFAYSIAGMAAEPPQAGSQRRIRAVGQVPAAGVVQRGEMHADLVGTAGLEVDVEQAGGLVGFERVVV